MFQHHLEVSRQRYNFLNKLANVLIRKNELIALEDQHIRNLVKNHHLSKNILDAGCNYLVQPFELHR